MNPARQELEYMISVRVFGTQYCYSTPDQQIYSQRIATLIEESFNRGCESVRAQAKAEKAPDIPKLEYTIVSHDSVGSLAATVQGMIESGWRPQGGVAALRLLSGISSDYTFCQAMTRGGKE